jgi:hypothetical protein
LTIAVFFIPDIQSPGRATDSIRMNAASSATLSTILGSCPTALGPAIQHSCQEDPSFGDEFQLPLTPQLQFSHDFFLFQAALLELARNRRA